MAMVGEALLSAAMDTLLDKITSSEFKDFFKSRKLNVSLLDELRTTLLALSVVLNDAEEKEITNHLVKKWLDELEDAVLDAEDLLDEVNYDSLRCKVEGESQTTANQVWKFLSSPFNQLNREMNSKMEEMCRRLKMFVEQKDILRLQSVSSRASKRTPTSSLIIESVMVGRVEDTEKLKNMLLSDDHAHSCSIGVVAILGMGGIGKTTLAQLLYNDKEVQQYFDLKAWVCVSEDFDVFRVTKTLLESVTSRIYDSNNLDFLRVELRQSLRDKKFLFVLDDLWNGKYNDWDDLRIPFTNGKEGSRIIITTRQQRVAEVSSTFPIYKLHPLSDDDCWNLLAKHAFGSEDLGKNLNLEKIGRKIAKKCGGLPIAAKTLGGLLRSKLDTSEWNEILNSNLWDLPSDEVLPALRLSYLYLPAHLKRCFAYCSIFPKDYPLNRKKLVLLWIAEGLVQSSHEDERVEEICDGYFAELLSRSLIQEFKDGNGDEFVMHDLVNDLATIVSKRGYFWCDGIKISEKIRHLSYKQNWFDHCKKFENIYSLKRLRTFLPLEHYGLCYLTRKLVNDFLPKVRFLRVVSFSNYENLTQLPDSIGCLVHLRYLDLSKTRIVKLPDTICMLFNLQTLILLECRLLNELPNHIGRLINLRHLNLCGTQLKVMPMQIDGLQSLRTLTTFVVGKQNDGLRVRELRKFPHLQGKLSILKLQNVNDAMDAYDANLRGKEKIKDLTLEWDKNTEDSRIEKDVLDHLQPSANLRKLTINWYGGTSFPTWLGDSSYCKMVSLCISNCCYCITLPPLGQLPSLKELLVDGIKLLERLGPEFYGQSGVSNPSFVLFPLLEHLEFRDMENWEEWVPLATEGSKLPFPHLKSLRLSNCPKLRQHLPDHLPSLSTVEISGCCELKTSSTLHWLTSIEGLNIKDGDQWSLVGDEYVSRCSLKSLSVKCCRSLPSLPKMIVGSNCLGRLILCDIPSLTCFPIGGLPTSLRSLHITECPNLEFLSPETWCNYTSLSDLIIKDSCDSLKSFPLDSFPALEHLKIFNCRNLESLSISEASMHHPSCLLQIRIDHCEKLRSLSERIHTLTNLQHLTLDGLPELASLPQAGLPLNLQSFIVRGCEKLSPVGIADWGLQHLTSLSHIEICGDGIVNALLEEPLLPNSLLRLYIHDASNLKSMKGNALQHFTSLRWLYFWDCQRLEFIAEDWLQCFSNLERLCLHDCEKLESLPEQGLPSSLSYLRIHSCPLLEARYQNQRGEHWSKIAHIPVIEINDEVII